MNDTHPRSESLSPVQEIRAIRPDDVSRDAMALLTACEVIDLHLDSLIAHRMLGYDMNRRHERTLLRGNLLGQIDFPRAAENGLTGGMWSITTNPFRRAGSRWKAFLKNVERLKGQVEASCGRVAIATSASEYRRARETSAIACLPSVQGANALSSAPEGIGSIPDRFVTRVTLVHLTNSLYGVTSNPLCDFGRKGGLTRAGKELVRDLDRHRVFVDLSHINPPGFWDAVAAHDPGLPLIVTHTGVDGAYRHWRNLDDDQIRAIADTGGTIGLIFQRSFLHAPSRFMDGRVLLDHMAHIIRVAGEDFVSIGSDYDGMILPPDGLRDRPGYPRLVQWMLDRRWTHTRIAKILGGNFLRCFEALRP